MTGKPLALVAGVLIMLGVVAVAVAAGPSSTAFTYQGELKQGGELARGVFDLALELYDQPTGGNLLGRVTLAAVEVRDGAFTVVVDFGLPLPGCGVNRFLETHVRPAGGSEYTRLLPRQPMKSKADCVVDGTLTVTAPEGTAVTGETAGTSSSSIGVAGRTSATSGIGVFGEADSPTGGSAGVYGYGGSESGYGVYGLADNNAGANYGVVGRADGPDGVGVVGHAFYDGVGVGAWSFDGNLIEAYDGDPPGGTLRFYITQAGGVYADSGYNTFKRVVDAKTSEPSFRSLTAISSPGAWFEDFGTGSVRKGEAIVEVEPLFAQTVNLDAGYHVFLTPMGDCSLYVAEQAPSWFAVRAVGAVPCSVDFHYRVVARQLGSEEVRLERVAIPEPGPELTGEERLAADQVSVPSLARGEGE